ncbi:acyl carrier protein [Collimonas sp. OK307]|uniref:hypothetical protein n=1 Tax=Collimonas sp. OK307 TaxID=1801620 RepID=UPI0008E11B0C|nr:hypothetical protein [Collimonas sp. OK307]SFH73645.1 acyl carrier protein [Collimonas sp. OK307]
MANEQTRDEVLGKVIDIFIDAIGWIKREELLVDARLVSDLKIDGDDLFVCVMQVEKYFDMRLTEAEWGAVATIEQVVDLVMRYRGLRIPGKKQPGILGWLSDRMSIKY